MNNILRKDIEYIVHSDERGNVIGPISKTHAHLPKIRPVLCHWATWVMIYHVNLEKWGVSLNKPKPKKQRFTKFWNLSVGGHNSYVHNNNEWKYLNFKETMIKEAKEEVGLDIVSCNDKNEFINKTLNINNSSIGFVFAKEHYKTKHNNEIVGFGIILTDINKLQFNDGEVLDFKWLASEEMKIFFKSDEDYSAALPIAFEKCNHYLTVNDINNK